MILARNGQPTNQSYRFHDVTPDLQLAKQAAETKTHDMTSLAILASRATAILDYRKEVCCL